MKMVMFTKHLQGWDLGQVISGLMRLGLDGADLCTRPGYPVNPENCATAMPAAARQFAEAGLRIEICTSPGDFADPDMDYAERLFASCAEAGVPRIKLGYWHYETAYWKTLDDCRRKMEGFARLAARHGVKALVHNHSGKSMGLNASAAMRLVDGFDPRHVGIFADAGHLSMVGEPLSMAMDISARYLEAWAIKDLMWDKEPGKIDGARRLKVVPFGYGMTEWADLVAGWKARGWDGVVSFHCEYGGYTNEAVIAQCEVDLRFIRRLLAEPVKA
jgi:sugar phosphate isomerase/epimerase